jgi:pteridine reductase
LEDWQTTLNINLTAPFLCTQTAARLMRENDPPGGAIVNILDKGALSPWPEYPHHGVSKAGLLALTQVSALNLAPDIRVNGIIPGPILKPAGSAMTDAEWEKLGKRTPLQCTGTPEDVGRAVVYLASESFVTGAIIPVNGGEHLKQR